MADPVFYAGQDLCNVARSVIGQTISDVTWEQKIRGADHNEDSLMCTLSDPHNAATAVRLAVAKTMVFDDVATMFKSKVGDPTQCQGKATNPGATLAAARETTLLCPTQSVTTFSYEGEFTDIDGYLSLDVEVPPTTKLDANQLQSWLNSVQTGLNAAT